MKPRPPRRKKYAKGSPKHKTPYINIKKKHKYSAIFMNNCCIVKQKGDMDHINSRGSFGKGNLSRNYPTYNEIQLPIVRKRQQEKYIEIIALDPNKKLEKKDIIQVPDSDSESEMDSNNYLKNLGTCELIQQDMPFQEVLKLSLEEAFYLTSGNMLNIYTLNERFNFNKKLNVAESWTLFSKNQKSFMANYIVYKYFRDNGWVVRPGIKFGGDFLLYKDGPAYYHASFLVIVDVIKSKSKVRFEELSTRSMDWTSLTCLDRLTETAAKELLIAQLMWPENLSVEQAQNLVKEPFGNIFDIFEVRPLLIRRWVPKIERLKFTKSKERKIEPKIKKIPS